MRKFVGFIVMIVLLVGCGQGNVEPSVLEETAVSTSSGQAPSTDSGQVVSESDEPLRFYISLTFVDDKTKEPVVADVKLLVDDDGDHNPKTGTWLEPPCIQVTACEFSVPVNGLMYLYVIEADGYEIHSLGVRPHYSSEMRLQGDVPLTRLVSENARTG